MHVEKNEKQTMSLQVTEGLTVTILPNSDHEFLMPTKDVAAGYGVSPKAIGSHLQRNSEDFIEGKHFVKGAAICGTLGKNVQPHQVYYTKRGVVRLGFFIKSDRAKMFRDWAEDLIIHQLDAYEKSLASVDIPPQTGLLYEFHSRVRTKVINGKTYYKVGDIKHLLKVQEAYLLLKKIKSLDNFVKISADYFNVDEWWCTIDGVREFLNTKKNASFLRLHDALFPSQLSLL